MGMTFNGIKKPYITVLRGRKRPAWASVERELISAGGRPGGYLSETHIRPRYVTVPVKIAHDGFSNLQKIKEDLASWLVVDEPKALIFDDEPDRKYFAAVDGELDLEEMVYWGSGVITFICPDPYKHGPKQSNTGMDTVTVQNQGTAPTYPIIEIELKEDTTFLAVGNGEKINMIGNPLSVDDTPVERLTRCYWSEADNLIGWAVPGAVEGGEVTGTMSTDGFRFYASDYGTGSRWHGPARKTSLPEILTDFQVDVLVELNNKDGWGKIIVSGLDQANNVSFSMSMGDAYATPQANGQIRAGNQGAGHNIISHIGNPPAWNDFRGLLRIGRTGNSWYAFISRYDIKTGHYETGMYRTWVDNANIYTRELAQIQVHIVSFGGRTPAIARLEDVKVYRVNDLAAEEIPYIGVKDDVFKFDHENDVIYKNGEIITKEKAFIGEYFDLKPGANVIGVGPAEVIKKTTAKWSEKYL